jgi:23S rRNA (cytosine1962-C5)-methyltransferase
MNRICSNARSDFELIDAGQRRKLERWGEILIIRPDRNAYFDLVNSNV